jgi:hypothetical protein
MVIVPGGNMVATGLMVVTSAAGVASVALEVEDRLAKEGHLKLDRRLAMDVLQVVAISLPFGTLTRTFAEASLVGKGRFLLCMTGLDIAQGFVIGSEVKDQLAMIEANTAVQLAGAASDDQRTAIQAERDRRVAEMIGGAVVNGTFLLVSLGHGIKRTIAITRAGARFAVREPVRELVEQGRERMEQALSANTFEHEGQRVQLTAEERRYLEHEIAAHQSHRGREPTATADTVGGPSQGNQQHREETQQEAPAVAEHTDHGSRQTVDDALRINATTDDRANHRPLERKPFRTREGAQVEAVEQGQAIVPTGKVEVYPRGKVKPFTKDMAAELKTLKNERQTTRREFDKDPSKAARIKKLEDLKHNQERSLEMAKSLERAGLPDIPEVNEEIIRHLLEVGQNINENNRVRFPSELRGSTGKIRLLSTWVILPDGRAFLSTVIVIPQ